MSKYDCETRLVSDWGSIILRERHTDPPEYWLGLAERRRQRGEPDIEVRLSPQQRNRLAVEIACDVSTLSKRDAEALGVADMTGPQLRARVFALEGAVADALLTLRDDCRPAAIASSALEAKHVAASLERLQERLRAVMESADGHINRE